MTDQNANATFYQLCISCCSVVAHLVSEQTSYPLNRATSDSTPKRGQVCQQLIHHAQYQSISKHKQNIFDIRDSWIGGRAWKRKRTHRNHGRMLRLSADPLSPRDWLYLAGSLASCNYFTSKHNAINACSFTTLGVHSSESTSSSTAESG